VSKCPSGRGAQGWPDLYLCDEFSIKFKDFFEAGMALIVQKFGGTSMGTTERIKSIAGRIAAFKVAGHQLVVVVSAMSGETNRPVALAKEIQPDPDPREFDLVLATGEPVKMR
jgi:aspartokinase